MAFKEGPVVCGERSGEESERTESGQTGFAMVPVEGAIPPRRPSVMPMEGVPWDVLAYYGAGKGGAWARRRPARGVPWNWQARAECS